MIGSTAGTARPFTASLNIAENQLTAASYGWGAAYGDNIRRAWAITAGRGVAIALVDDGFTPGAIADFDLSVSRSFGASAGIGEPNGVFPHGTTTSGLIGASQSATGLVGVAVEARIIGVRVDFGGAPFSQFTAALGYAAQHAAVVNNSWSFGGFNPGAIGDALYSGWDAAMQVAVAVDRAGLGAAVVFAAGNDRANANTVAVQPVQDDPRVIAVAASTVDGTVADYSNAGSGLLVAAVGDQVAVPDVSPASYYVANGTSYAAPAVSGIVAMMLSVNPDLGWRDIQEILADAAYAPAPSADGFTVNAGHGWNGGGMHFSNDLGFGVLDASVAVDLARSWSGQHTSANLQLATVTQSRQIRVARNGTAKIGVTVAAPLRVEHVQVHIDDLNLPLANTTVTLISPSGTRSVLLAQAGLAAGQDRSGAVDLDGDSITSNAFWGEPASGAWTLQVIDKGGASIGTLQDWNLTIWGDSPGSADMPLVYTPEFAALAAANPARAVVSAAGTATRTIDLIDLPQSSNMNLNGGSGTIDGVAVRVEPGLRNVNATGSTGALTVVSSVSGSAITGADGPTTVTGAGGSDTVTAGTGRTVVYCAGDPQMRFFAGAGASTLYGAIGEATLTGAAAADTLIVLKGKAGGRYDFANFTAGADQVRALGYSVDSLTQALAGQASDTHSGVLVTLSDGSRIDFSGLASVTGSAFGL